MTLHESAIKKREREREELKKRELVHMDAFNWNVVKKISEEQPFQKYIELLIQKGQ